MGAGREATFDEIRRRGSVGDDEGAVVLADSLAESTTDPRVAGRALMLKVGYLYNLGRTDECTAVLDRAFGTLDGLAAHSLLGGLHAMAGIVAIPTSMGRGLWHLVQGARELEAESKPGPEAVDAWHNLAVCFSYSGYHSQAVTIAEATYQLGKRLGRPAGDHVLPEVAVRQAVAVDHTARCARLLRETLETWSRRLDPSRMWHVEQCYYAYATVRLAAFGEHVEPRSDLFDVDVSGWEVRDLRLLGEACADIARGEPRAALARLDGAEVDDHTLGAGELCRLRALAHVAAGDLRAAVEADRCAARRASAPDDDLREILVLGSRARIDDETLRRKVERHASEALTDPLTGLPNRRHFERWVAEGHGVTVVGVIDLDDFKRVNTVHGHAGGDVVLQRIAAVLARTLPPEDFVCRFGGDEFVVALSDADLDTAIETGDRIRYAVAEEDWDALVVGTPVAVTVGWAELGAGRTLEECLHIADAAMFTHKRTVERSEVEHS